MSMRMDKNIRRRTARRKSAVPQGSIQSAPAAAEANRQYDMPPPTGEQWADNRKQ